MTSSSVTFPQGYPLWIAAVRDSDSAIRVGRIIGWTDRAPLVIWKAAEPSGTRRLSAPDTADKWWVGDTEADARAEAVRAITESGTDGDPPR